MSGETCEISALQRQRLMIRGAVQGVGFRPFVYACARNCNLSGFVGNKSDGVFVEIEGTENNLINFLKLLRENPPPLAHITEVKIENIKPKNEIFFRIVESETHESANTLISPDVNTCGNCLEELFDRNNRRFRYPFINCTNCGPRFTIIEDMPYDRTNTTMSMFQMCRICQDEYDNRSDRRFHAQPNACLVCGPQVCFITNGEQSESFAENAILKTQQVLFSGSVVAIKGIGGFHLACDARNNSALQKLRERKGRVDKPFAVMVRDIATAQNLVEINEAEQKLLTDKERPIV